MGRLRIERVAWERRLKLKEVKIGEKKYISSKEGRERI